MNFYKPLFTSCFFLVLQLAAFGVLAKPGSDDVKKTNVSAKATGFKAISISNDDAGNILLNWVTNSPAEPGELFVVERSLDGINGYKAIGTIKANAGSSYRFIDQLPIMGTGYYRVKRKVKDVVLATSPVRYLTLFFSSKYSPLEIFTNKKNGEAIIQYYSLYPETIRISIKDNVNRPLEFERAIKQGVNVMVLNLSLLNSGVYQLDLNSSQGFYASVINNE